MDSSSTPMDVDSNEPTTSLENDLRYTQTSGPSSAPTYNICLFPKRWMGNSSSFVLDHFKKVEGCLVDEPKASVTIMTRCTLTTQRGMRLHNVKPFACIS